MLSTFIFSRACGSGVTTVGAVPFAAAPLPGPRVRQRQPPRSDGTGAEANVNLENSLYSVISEAEPCYRVNNRF